MRVDITSPSGVIGGCDYGCVSVPHLAAGAGTERHTRVNLNPHLVRGSNSPKKAVKNYTPASARVATCLTARERPGPARIPRSRATRILEAGRHALDVVVNGKRAMPPFKVMMNDDQVAAVVNYVRTHFGNNYRDAVTAEDVKAVRPEAGSSE